MDTLKAGDTYKIAGKEYTIGAEKADAEKLITDAIAAAAANNSNETVSIDGADYVIDKDGKISKGGTELGADATADLTEIKKLVVAGATVKYGDKSMTVMDAQNGVDKDDSSVITADHAKELIQAELLAANNIGTIDLKATVEAGKDDAATGKTSYKINKGYATVANTLSFNLHVGADADMTNKITVDIDTMNSSNLGIKGINVKDATGTAATYAIDAIADAVSKVSSQRSSLGAVQNRLEHTIDNLDNISENTSSAESRIRDTDMAKEMVNYSKNNILAQAGQSMLAQANQSNQGVLSLLQ